MTATADHPSKHVTCCVCGEIINGVGMIDHADGEREIYHQRCWLEKYGPERKPWTVSAYLKAKAAAKNDPS